MISRVFGRVVRFCSTHLPTPGLGMDFFKFALHKDNLKFTGAIIFVGGILAEGGYISFKVHHWNDDLDTKLGTIKQEMKDNAKEMKDNAKEMKDNAKETSSKIDAVTKETSAKFDTLTRDMNSHYTTFHRDLLYVLGASLKLPDPENAKRLITSEADKQAGFKSSEPKG